MVNLAPLVATTNLDAERTLLTRALEVRRACAAEHPDLALTLGALAQHHQRRGELERSRELFRQALAVFRDPGERRHPASVTLMGDYANLLSTLKAYDEAEATLREAIAVGEQVLGPGTLTVADLTNNLGVVLAALGRHADAERAFRESFDRHVVLFGESHWRIRNVARNLGLVLSLQERYREALPWMDRAVSSRAVADTDDIGLEGIRAQRAWVVFVVGRHAEALDAASRAVSALEGMKDPSDGHVLAYSRIVLARLLSETGRPDAAEPAARAAMAWFERWGPSTHSAPMLNARSDARRCFRDGRRKAGPRWSTACLFIAPGVMPIPARTVPRPVAHRGRAGAPPGTRGPEPPGRPPWAAQLARRLVRRSAQREGGSAKRRRARASASPVTSRFDAIPVVTSIHMTGSGVGRSIDWARRIVGLDLELPLLDGRLARYINLDNAATTPPLRDVLDAVLRFLPYYSSVHRGAGVKSRVSTAAYDEAHRTIAGFVGANTDTNTVIFGKNTTEAINKLSYRYPLSEDAIVLSTLMEHHSNDLPWRRRARVVRATATSDGRLDEDDLGPPARRLTAGAWRSSR